jgi:arabinose-5-phosphate isomerase
MEQRSFSPEDFRGFHPGGKLGAILSTVGDLMQGPEGLPLVSIDAPMSDALIEISARGFGVVGVLARSGALAGVITDGDLRRNMENLTAKSAAEVMNPEPKTIGADVLATDALVRMNREKITTLFITDPGTGAPRGLLHIHDCLRAGLG